MDDRRDDDQGTDEAVFRVARVGARAGGRATLAAFALTLSGGVLVATGTLGGPDAPAQPAATVMRDIPVARPVPAPDATFRPRSGPAAESILVLHTRAWSRYVFVHADVFTLDAEVVIVSIWDARDEVVGIRSVDMPGGGTALRTGANDRFQIAFTVDGVAAAEVEYVVANAYDRFGRLFASERQWLDPPTDPGYWRSEAGA